ncbi:tRNA N(3)-methylcytidine methyltransferase METTL2 [Halotydeus destructor]|nr:tRNA N(3)-methylcytidine methyltransferase METTL2 [Halotydeus destructor]
MDGVNKRPQFGQRFLTESTDVYQHNAWDNVEWDDEQQDIASKIVKENSSVVVDEDKLGELEEKAAHYWDEFYSTHQREFFKDRNWLFTEFQELIPQSVATSTLENLPDESYEGSNSKFKIFEIGCGVGNTIIPILQMDLKNTFIYGCDFSSVAIELFKKEEKYESDRCLAFVCDVASPSWTVPFPLDSLDIILSIFTLSAINPNKIEDVIKNCVSYLKPGGYFLFRDYGLFDMAQLRFKKGKCLGPNFYVRGDGTRAYFFSEDEIDSLLTKAGLEKVQLTVDRRLQVNRRKQLKMYRVYSQAKYRKPLV